MVAVLNGVFSGSGGGSHWSAVVFKLIATCNCRTIDTFTYLRDVLTRLATHPSNRVAEVLPNNWKSKQ